MIPALQRILKASNRSLIRELVASDFKMRYQGSVMGYLWSLLRPLMLFGVLYIVFTKIVPLGKDTPYWPAQLLLGLVLWTFFVEATLSGMNAITGRGDLVRKVNIPKYTLVISTTLSAFVNFCLNMVVVIIFMILSNVPLNSSVILAPLFIIELVALSLAISFLLAALFVKFRDLSHIWEVVLQIAFYATPIIFPFAMVPAMVSHNIAQLLSLNPLAQIFQDMRSVMISPTALTTKQVFGSQLGRILPMLIVVVLVVLAVWYFRRASRNFAEEL